MKIEYEPTREDLKAAYLAYRSQKPIYAILSFLALKFAPCALVISVILAFASAHHGHLNPWLYNLPPLLFALTAAGFIDRSSTLGRLVKNLFPTGVSDRRFVVAVDDEKIVSSIPNATRSEYSWGSISLFLCSAQTNLLYVAPERFILIPNRVLTPDQSAWLKEIIARKGIKTKSC